MRKTILILAVVFAASIMWALADMSIGWRMDGTGKYPDADPPMSWSSNTNIVWKTPISNWSNSSPILVDGRLYFCAEPTDIVCLDAETGQLLWQHSNTYVDLLRAQGDEETIARMEEIGMEETTNALRKTESQLGKAERDLKKSPDDEELRRKVADLKEELESLKEKLEPVADYVMPKTHDTNGYSSPTPASDGRNVYVVFGTGVAASYTLDGELRWIRFIEKPTHDWGHSASPVLVDGKVIVHILSLVALDVDTGEIVWRGESKPHWGSPIATTIGEKPVIITTDGDIFDADTGEKIAQNLSMLEYATPIQDGDCIYFIEYEGEALRLPAEYTQPLQVDVLWQTKPKKDRYYASALYHEGLISAITRNGHFSVIDAETGDVIYEKPLKLKGTIYPSITMAGEYLFISSDTGKTLIFKPGAQPEQVAENDLEPFRTTPIFEGSRMYVRTHKNFYCIGE